ncbi:MAG TPA: FAD-dependent oxidoreductase [Candidatus Polarisedimenticolaceae bacterium]|nr:FAD-dependent oxidoreductase [Candidatus Polarisedimenticolaceae bacterium]
MKIAVAGGGVFGLTAALELAQRGHAVALFDPGPLPHPEAASTDINKAVRLDYGTDTFYTDLAELAIEGWHAWNRRCGERLYHEDGFLLMTRSPLKPGEFEHDSYEALVQRGYRLERMNAAALAKRFPAWRAEAYVDGYFNPRGGWAEAARVVRCLAGWAEAAGVEIHTDAGVEGFVEDDATVGGVVLRDGTIHRADRVLVAAGAWTPVLLPRLAKVMWATGQPVLHFRPRDPANYQPERFPVWGAEISRTGWYGFPLNRDGLVKVGNHGPGRGLHPGEPRVVASTEEGRFREFFRNTFPGLVGAPLVASRLCLYTDTWDSNFWIDHDPERPGLVVASGGSGHAFKFAPVLGAIIADVLERKPNPWAPRFTWRPRGKLTTEQARRTG